MEPPFTSYKVTSRALEDWQHRCDPRLARIATMEPERFRGLDEGVWRNAFRNREAARAALRMPMLALPSLDLELSGPTESPASGTSLQDGVLWLDVVVQANGPVDLGDLGVADTTELVVPHSPQRFVMTRVRADRLPTLAARPGVEAVELARPITLSGHSPVQQRQPADEKGDPEQRQDDAHEGPWRPAPAAPAEPLRTLIGIVDYAFDVLHPDLCWSVGYERGWPAYQPGPGGRRSKVLALFYPLDTADAPDFTPDDAPEDELASWAEQATAKDPHFQSYQQLKHDPVGKFECIDEHGTMCAWVAAGRNHCPQGPGHGAAPDAELLLAAFKGKERPAPGEVMPNSNDLVRAVQRMDRQAGKRPLVINISLASHFGPHDGTSPDVRAIDAIAQRPGRAVVVAAGNDNLLGRHVQLDLKPGARGELHWRVDEAPETTDPDVARVRPTTPDRMQVWGRNCKRLRTWFLGPDMDEPVELRVNHSGVIEMHTRDGRSALLHWDNRARWPGNGDPRFELSWTQRGGSALPLGDWKLLVEPVTFQDGSGPEDSRSPRARVDAWLGINDAACIRWVSPEPTVHEGTLNELATGRHTIVVGNAGHGRNRQEIRSPHHGTPQAWLNCTSGCGPTRDGRNPTGFAAHGTLVRVPCARDRTNGKHFPVELSRFASGTSVAAPHVAGIAARVLARHPTLNSLGVAEELKMVARPASTTQGWFNGYLP